LRALPAASILTPPPVGPRYATGKIRDNGA
jgi:hypothetical protein